MTAPGEVHHVYLIPGFFGFSQLGDVTYFRAVRETMERAFTKREARVAIFAVNTFPTGSLRRRAARLVDTILANQSHTFADKIHLVGHSTGALDARIVASPMLESLAKNDAPTIRKKLSTIVSVAGPHYGTPVAHFFTTLYGKQLLYFVTLTLIASLWRTPLSIAGDVMSVGYRLYDMLGLSEPLLEQFTDQILRGFSKERQAEVKTYLSSVLEDQSLMTQITPESMDILSGTLTTPSTVRLVSYGAVAPRPSRAMQRIWRPLLSPLESTLYATLYNIASKNEGKFRYHPPIEPREAVTGSLLPHMLDESENDGLVPSMSMICGEFRGFVRADHIDLIGHYLRGPFERRDGADWLASGADFTRADFESLWTEIVDVILRRI
jgi:hypothetical protein